MTSTISAAVDSFVSIQNQGRGKTLASGATLSLDYNALSGTVPAGDNAVTGVAGIAPGASEVFLPSGQNGNAVIIDGTISTTASNAGPDSYSLVVDTTGLVTLTDNNTGNSETISHANYLVFDSGATMSSGAYQSAYIIESGVAAQMAAMYNAAYGRIPDLQGLEFYIDQYGSAALPDLHTMATYFLSAAEFKTHWPTLQTTPDNGGPNDQAYINSLYGEILHRTPSAAEVQFYVGALQGTLKDSNGHLIAAADRAQLLVFFSVSPENAADISANNGGWLINTSNGLTSLGIMTTSTANSVLASDLASGAVDANSFSGLPTTSRVSYTDSSGNNITIVGGDVGIGTPNREAFPLVSTQAPNITINLSADYYAVSLDGQNDTVNGPANGGGIFLFGSQGDAFPDFVNVGGTANLSGNINWLTFGNDAYASTVPVKVFGWNSTDIIVDGNGKVPTWSSSPATLLSHPDGTVYTASAGAINGAAISSGANAINVGTITDDSVAAIVKAANSAFHENGNILSNYSAYSVFFFGEDPQGNTMVWYWRGDTNSTGNVQASDITGGIELIGVSATSLTGANFHH